MVITTRSRPTGEDLANGESCVKVPLFSVPEGINFFRLKAKDATDAADSSTLNALLDTLEYIPLAITQAAAFVKRNEISLDKYLAALEKSEKNLVDHLSYELQDHRREHGFPNAIFRTWRLTFDQLRTHEPEAANLLSLMAMLDRQAISEVLLYRLGEKDVQITSAIGSLEGFSLITKSASDETIAMHRLVQLSVHQWLEHEGQKIGYTSQVLQLLAEQFPLGTHENKEACQSLLPHAQAVLKYGVSENDERHRTQLLYNLGWFEMAQGRYESANQCLSVAHEIDQKLFGDFNSRTLNSLELMAKLLQRQGKYEKAEMMSRRALEGFEKLEGFDSVNTLGAADSLAMVLGKQEKYEEAEKMHRRVLEKRDRLLGAEHRDTLTSVSNLASVLCKLKKYETARKMYQRDLEGSEKMLGAEHPDTLISLHNVGAVLIDLREYEVAERMLQRALEGKERVLGVGHPSTLSTVWALAVLYYKQRMYSQAIPLYRRASEGFLKVLGPDHPDTLRCSRYYQKCASLCREASG